ncbi:MAG: hypothetical protein DMG02_31255 [Acidobacteria bacterium]|nr:MAG: hypothetical protein DMG03_22255 [Acidobacteriota bacterium]PYQ84383.1 MAG: hypothetical protein DMG02_31255 [Acidobacteriota bacterium]PYR05764.1 MAG: hypothetical protein DMF99_27550 [Acidobacteriota bacterium]
MIPDYFEAITAYRVFNVFENGLLAGSAFVEPWPPYEPFVARCGAVSYEGAGEHVRDGRFVSAPVYGCDCGIHVVRTPAAALERVRMERRAHALRLQHLKGPAGRAWGAVKIWGRVIEHESGYRAEFAYPSNLQCDDAKLARRVAALYGVPCDYTPLDDREPAPSHDKSSSAKMDDYNNRPLFNYQPPQDLGTCAIGVLLLFLSMTLQLTGVTSHQPAAPASEVLGADTQRTTVEGARFVAPDLWRIERRGPATILESPEGNSHIALVYVHAADADRAVAAAWAAYRPDVKWPLKVTNSLPDKDGWTDIREYTYQTSANEKRDVEANARRKGDIWTVVLSDMDQGVAEKRLAQVALIYSRLFPKHYERE